MVGSAACEARRYVDGSLWAVAAFEQPPTAGTAERLMRRFEPLHNARVFHPTWRWIVVAGSPIRLGPARPGRSRSTVGHRPTPGLSHPRPATACREELVAAPQDRRIEVAGDRATRIRLLTCGPEQLVECIAVGGEDGPRDQELPRGAGDRLICRLHPPMGPATRGRSFAARSCQPASSHVRSSTDVHSWPWSVSRCSAVGSNTLMVAAPTLMLPLVCYGSTRLTIAGARSDDNARSRKVAAAVAPM
jgi:hypothetical protein